MDLPMTSNHFIYLWISTDPGYTPQYSHKMTGNDMKTTRSYVIHCKGLSKTYPPFRGNLAIFGEETVTRIGSTINIKTIWRRTDFFLP